MTTLTGSSTDFLEQEHHGRGQRLLACYSAQPVCLTAMSYFSIDERTLPAPKPPSGGLLIHVPWPPKFAISLLAVGIGDEGGETVDALASAPWFSHLRPTIQGLSRISGRAVTSILNDVPDAVGPHVVSVALPRRPNQAEVEAACSLGNAARQRGAFAVVTVSEPSQAATAQLGSAFDCLVHGDGSTHHHWYPSRTVTEPAGGRMICYDLYDVCSLWAGRVGSFGIVDPATDALHVEVSTDVESLFEVNRLVYATAAGLNDPERLSFFNVVTGARSGATAVSFSDSELVRQERTSARRQHGDRQ